MHLDKPTYLNGKPAHCCWCGNTLAQLRHVYKGVGCARYYDSETCLVKGEQMAAEMQLKRVAQAAGMVHSPPLVGAIVLALAMVAFIFSGGMRAF